MKKLRIYQVRNFITRFIYAWTPYEPRSWAYNRRFMTRSLERLVESDKPFSLILVDINSFIYINDRFGHGVGDQIVRNLVRRYKKSIRWSKPYREGGDSFAFLVEGEVDRRKLKKMAQETLAVMAVPFPIEGDYFTDDLGPHKANISKRTVSLVGSAGISSYPQDSDSAKGIHKNASEAQYWGYEDGQISFFDDGTAKAR